MSGRELIDHYEAYEHIYEGLQTDVLTEEETINAALSTQHDRAQLVVDRAAGILLGRREQLVQDVRELHSWQSEMLTGIAEIDEALIAPQKRKADRSSLPDIRRELVKATLYGDWDAFI